VLPTWQAALDAPGAVQMSYLKRTFLERPEWWRLVPDQYLFAAGGRTTGDLLNLAAQHPEGRWVLVYLAASAAFSLHMDKLAGADRATATWIDPRTGRSTPAGIFSTRGVQAFTTPDGWEDALLIVETVRRLEPRLEKHEVRLRGLTQPSPRRRTSCQSSRRALATLADGYPRSGWIASAERLP
jgi:collagenase-like protein with putative collagen-binding domain